MTTKIKLIIFIFLATVIGLSACKKTEYSLGELVTPSTPALDIIVAGTDVENPGGNGTGSVTVTTSATNVITYRIDFGDDKFLIVPNGTTTYKYTNPGTSDYTVTATAIGTGGLTSSTSKTIKVFVAFTIPPFILDALTGGSSKTWMINKTETGYFGVGPAAEFRARADWWLASPTDMTKSPAFDDEVTFSKDELDNVSMMVDNKGLTYMKDFSTTFYGFPKGPDAGYALVTEDTKKLAFMDATSASTPEVSTRIQFVVPGNGIIIWGAGATEYEILEASPTKIQFRNIGLDGNAWYQVLIPK